MRLIVSGALLGALGGSVVGALVGYNAGSQLTWVLLARHANKRSAS